MKILHPVLRRLGIDVGRPPDVSKPLLGKDFPQGIDHLDLQWFEGKVTLETLAACETEADLWNLKHQAEFCLLLRQLKRLAQEA